MLVASPNHFRWWYANQAVPVGATPGLSVTPGASDTEGADAVLATEAEITQDVYGILLSITDGSTSNQAKNHLLDLGWDPAGGTSYTYKVNNIVCGGSAVGGAARAGRVLWLPVRIPAGSEVAVRIQGSNATAGTVRVCAVFFGRPTHPEMCWAGSYSETIGAITGSNGPTFTPGSSAAEGAWTSLGTTTRRLRYLLPSVQVNDASANAQMLLIDLAYDDGSGTKVIVIEHLPLFNPGTVEQWGAEVWWPNAYCDIPPGAELFIRGSTSLATPDAAYNATVIGIG